MRSQRTFWKFTQSNGPVLLAIFFTFFMSVLVSRTVFERLPHLEDEVAYLFQARIFARGEVVVQSPDPRNAFWQPFVVDYSDTGARFGKYTPGWPAMLSIGVSMGQAWLVNALLSALTVALVYRLGSEVYNRDVGRFAALLTAFSPAALLLNASLMGHTAALFYATLFMYSYWRIEKRRYARRWGIVAGLALGMMAMTRPLTSIAIAMPFIAWSAVRLLSALSSSLRRKSDDALLRRVRRAVLPVLTPLLLLSVMALSLALTIPAFNAAATGDPTQNLYELVWSYDKMGFGECCGRSGHTLERAFRHTRFDLSLTAADLFGWQLDPVTEEMQDHLRTSASYHPAHGLSFVLLPIGLLMGVLPIFSRTGISRTRLVLLVIWSAVALAWVWFPINMDAPIIAETLGLQEDLIRDPAFAWFWILFAQAWLLLPLLVIVLRWMETPQIAYTWLFACIVLGIVLTQMTYWIGSQRYSTRYYYEALTAAAILSALPLAWLAAKLSRRVIYALVILLCVGSLYHYSTPRIEALYRFNFISPQQIEAVEARREGDGQLLVMVTGETSGDDRVRWRSYGTLMAVTSPFLDSEIVVARDFGNDGFRERILANFDEPPQIIEMQAIGNIWQFADE